MSMPDIYKMSLADEYFELMRDGKKIIELRVNDAKRKKYKVGNVLNFQMKTDPSEKFSVEITALYYFQTIREAVEGLGKDKFGFKPSMTIDKIEDLMLTFYKQEEIDKDGIVCIEIKKI